MRSTSENTDLLIRRLLAAHLVEDVDAPPNYSVALADTSRRGAVKDLHLLYRSSSLVVRSRAPSRVLRALVMHMSAFATADDTTDGLLAASVTAAVIDGEAILLPPQILGWLKVIQPRLNRLGVQLVDQPVSQIDTKTGELVVPAPRLTVDEAVLADLDKGVRLRSELPSVLPGRYRLRAWLFSSGAPDLGVTSRAEAVARVFGTIGSGTRDTRSLLEDLAHVFTETTPCAVSLRSPEDFVAQLQPIAAQRSR